MNVGQRNLAWADALFAALAAAGLRHVVIAPGARSAPLAVAALRRRELVCQVINDERAAGFFALGVGKTSGAPAAVVTTSGTAAANLLPAIVEANLSATPLLALTADRPPELVGWGANQTIDQHGLYAGQLRVCHRLPPPTEALPARYFSALASRWLRDALGPPAGPVHVNLPFSEPLLPEAMPPPPTLPRATTFSRGQTEPQAEVAARLGERLASAPGVILCGEGRFSDAEASALGELAERLAVPLLAEALSGLRYGAASRNVLAHASRFLRQRGLPAPAWVLRFGRFPLSRALEHWLAGLAACEQILVTPPGEWPDPLWQSRWLIEAEPSRLVAELHARMRASSAHRAFRASWCAAEETAARAAMAVVRRHFFEGTVARLLLETLPAHAQLFVGNSLAIRALDAFGGTRHAPLAVFANRGASGIDGNLATAAGIAAASGLPTFAFVGEQTLLHDATSLGLCKEHKVGVIVLANGGGGIFRHLPFADRLSEELLRRAFLAPPNVNFAALAEAFGLEHRRVADHETLRAALCHFSGGVVEAVIDPAQSRRAFASRSPSAAAQ